MRERGRLLLGGILWGGILLIALASWGVTRPSELEEFSDGVGAMPTRIDNHYHRMDDSTELIKQIGLTDIDTKKRADKDYASRATAAKRADKDLQGYSGSISAGLDEYTQISRAIDSDSAGSFHTDGTRKDSAKREEDTSDLEKQKLLKDVGIITTAISPPSDMFGVPSEYDDGIPTGRNAAIAPHEEEQDLAAEQHDQLMKDVGVVTPHSSSGIDDLGMDDLGIPEGRREASASLHLHDSHPRRAKLYNLRDGLMTSHSSSEPSFIRQAQDFLEDPKSMVKRLERRQARADRLRDAAARKAAAAAASVTHATAQTGLTDGSLARSVADRKADQVLARYSDPISSSIEAYMKTSKTLDSHDGSILPHSRLQAPKAQLLHKVQHTPMVQAQAVSDAAEVQALPVAEAVQTMTIVQQPGGSLVVEEAPPAPAAVTAVPVAEDDGRKVKADEEKLEKEREELEEERDEDSRRRKVREVQRMSEAYEQRMQEMAEERRKRQQRLDDEVMRDKEAIEIRKLRKQVRHMREKEQIKELRGSVAALKSKLSSAGISTATTLTHNTADAASGDDKAAHGDKHAGKASHVGDDSSKAADEGGDERAGGEGDDDKGHARGEHRGTRVKRREVQTVKVCDGMGCREVVIPATKQVAAKPEGLKGAKTRREIRDALNGGMGGGDLASWLLPWSKAFKSEVHVNDKGEIRADHDDPHGVLVPHNRYQNAVYGASIDKPYGEDHARKAGEERPGVTNRIGKHLFQDNIVKAEDGFNAGLGRHTRAQQAADWERNWEGVRVHNRKGQEINIGSHS